MDGNSAQTYSRLKRRHGFSLPAKIDVGPFDDARDVKIYNRDLR
jgi:hypothetical protein